MPLSVKIAGGPGSTNLLSNLYSLTERTGNNSVFPEFGVISCSNGIQLIKSSEYARKILVSPKYIQYLPFTSVATIRLPTRLQTIDPDFDHSFAYFPLYAFLKTDPCFVHFNRSVEVAISSRALSPLYAL